MAASKMLMVLAAALPMATLGQVTRDCMSQFTTGINDARVAEACDWVDGLESCLGELSIPINEQAKSDISAAEGILGANQVRYGCQKKSAVVRRGTQIGTDDGNVNIDVDEDRDFHVSRVYRDSVNVWQMNENLKGAETEATSAADQLGQIKIDIAKEKVDLSEIRQQITDHSDATVDLAKLEERVNNLAALNARVKALRKSLAGVSANKNAFSNNMDMLSAKLADDVADEQDAFEASMLAKVAVAVAAAADAAEAANNIEATAEKMPAGSVVQAVMRHNENTGGDRCDNSYCVQIPHYGNNMNNYRKSPCFIQMKMARSNSYIFFRANQYIYTIGGSHYYMDYKRSVNGGGDVSMVIENRKSGITDQLYGGHPSQGGGYMNYPVFLDRKVKSSKGDTVKYTLWVASWSGGRQYLQGYPNNNERSLNTYNMWEIAT